jgi:putative peptide zinc metalloprotease protein
VSSKAPLADGSVIRLGDVELRIERRRDDSEAGKTIVLRAGTSLMVPAVGKSEVEAHSATMATTFGFRPKVRKGWALKRLEAAEGARRFVLRDLETGDFVRMAKDEAELFQMLDGSQSLVELISEAEERFGAAGSTKLAGLLADLGERGFLEGVEKARTDGAPQGWLRRATKPRHLIVPHVGDIFEAVYRRGGFLFFSRVGLTLVSAVAVAGIGAFAYMVLRRYGTPFVVAKKIGLGGLVFLCGRFVVVAFHELAHGLTVASFGRKIQRAGLKTMMIFPYAFVDTSEAWFEPRRRRIAISAAGPVSDFTVGGAFSLVSLGLEKGTIRDILFNLAFAAYVGAFFNLNPFLERDGYHMMVDILREPGLRKRSRLWMTKRLSGKPVDDKETRAFRIYAGLSVFWSLSGLLFAVIGTKRFYPILKAIAVQHGGSKELVIAGFAFVYLIALLPFVVMVGRPLLERVRRKEPEPADAAVG